METATATAIDVEFDETPPAGAGVLAIVAHNQAVAVTNPQGAGFMSLIEKAVVAGNLDLVDRMMGLQERWEKNEGVKAFNNALAAAKADIKPIIKNRTVGFESKNGGKSTSYNHEDIAGIADSIDEILGANGLFYRWRPTNNPETGLVSVACIVSHHLGHSEETVLSGKIDVSGNKNHLQAVGSAVTYLERYTLKAALGLASKHDDDGRASGAPLNERPAMAPANERAAPITEDTGELLSPAQIAELQDLIMDRKVDAPAFVRWAASKLPGAEVVRLGDIPARFFDSCVKAIKQRHPETKQ
jgi:hypothetical protein